MTMDGTVKRMVSRAILHGDVTVHGGQDFYNYCAQNLTTVVSSGATSAKRRAQYQCSSRSFAYISTEEMDDYRTLRNQDMRYLPGTRKLHSVCSTDDPGFLKVRELTCLCAGCESGTRCPNADFVGPKARRVTVKRV